MQGIQVAASAAVRGSVLIWIAAVLIPAGLIIALLLVFVVRKAIQGGDGGKRAAWLICRLTPGKGGMDHWPG